MCDLAIHMSGSSLIATHVWVGLSSQICLGSTEPANYTSSYATGSKEIVDMEIGMCQGAEQSDTTAE